MLNGDRVGAIKGFDKNTLSLFGFGVYVCEEVPPEDGIQYSKIMSSGNQKDHKILLDDGNIIYGSECWLFDEIEVRKSMKRYDHIEYMDINICRHRWINE